MCSASFLFFSIAAVSYTHLEGEKDLGISGKRVHSPKLTELLKEYEDTNLHMAFHAAAESTDELLLYISNCEYDLSLIHIYSSS